MTTNPLDLMGYSPAEITELVEEFTAKEDPKLHREVCSCGHPISKHKINEFDTNIIDCAAGRYRCPCQSLRPVISAPDLRYFMRKSRGNGKLHALVLGIHAAISAKADSASEMEWLIKHECEKCKTEGVTLHPTYVSPHGIVMDDPQERTAMLCDTCRF